MIRPYLVPALALLAASTAFGPLAMAQTAAPPTAKPVATKPVTAKPAAKPSPTAPKPTTGGTASSQALAQPIPLPSGPPIDPALKAATAAMSPSDPVLRFYQRRNFKPAWNKAEETQLIGILNDATRQALNPKDFLPDLNGVRGQERDIRLTRAALDYASALADGRVDPNQVEDIFTLHRNVVDVAGGLSAAVDEHQLTAWFKSLPPDDKGYQGLTSAYLRYRDIAMRGGWPAFKPGAVIKPGAVDPRIPALTKRLLAEGDLDHPVDGAVYTPELVEAMKIFQQRHGLPDDGVIGADTQDELRATAEDRARMIATNLERRRWLARTVASERIDVNTAASILVYWKDGKPYGRPVINGKANKPTPSIEASFTTILANPPWNVPADIAAKEIFPKGPAYLAAEDMYIAADGHVVQRAGPKSALGLVKFEVVDPYAIYLHDTPSRRLFARNQRHLSHGCIRVSDAVEFARMLLADNPEALATFDEAQASHDSKRVQMGREIPVRLLYWTAFMTGADRVAFRKDVYGWDSKLGEALGVGALSFKPADRTKTEDVGP
jgi:murein L,D-transpeptidase YcbB/YkuD